MFRELELELLERRDEVDSGAVQAAPRVSLSTEAWRAMHQTPANGDPDTAAKPLAGMAIQVPWGENRFGDEDDIQYAIRELGGRAANAPPGRPLPRRATHEYVADGAVARTELPAVTRGDLVRGLAGSLRRLADFYRANARTAHVPVVAPAAEPGRESRYFGEPWMPDGMTWPEFDGDPMAFVLQLDTASLPDGYAERDGPAAVLPRG